MATNRSTSRVRASRHSARGAASALVDRIPPETAAACDEIQDAIEDERSRLMTVEALLHCIVIAMNDHDGDISQGPDYHTLVALARDLVRRSIDQLDSMHLRPLLMKHRVQEFLEVKECSVNYVH